MSTLISYRPLDAPISLNEMEMILFQKKDAHHVFILANFLTSEVRREKMVINPNFSLVC
jgi:hypothetical protein